jgi:hypothetical protein
VKSIIALVNIKMLIHWKEDAGSAPEMFTGN